MALAIDTATYRKDLRYAPGHGWGSYQASSDSYIRRERRPSSIVVHTTNGRVGSAFSSEAAYLRDAKSVSCQYLVGKEGQVALILPETLEAWHAGSARLGFSNVESIGIECHLGVLGSNGQTLPQARWERWTEAQQAALTALCRDLLARWSIPSTKVETHRAIALPPGRKVDPTNWSDADFYAWRDTLRADPWQLWAAKGHPIGEHEKPWAIAQAWLRQRDKLGAALTGHIYPYGDDRWLYVLFERGVIAQARGQLPTVEVF
jgi:N-acetyl-anhydromuramyl-L-alanine amidase AmpD